LSVNGTANNTTGTWGVFSDIRSKENVTDYTRGLSDLMKLHPVTFSYKPEFGMGTGTHIGFIAQELQAVSPESVTNLGTIHGLDNFLENNQEGLMQMTIRAIQELKHQNDMLQSENESLKKRLDAIEARLR
jgi:Chaperone of endosialidase